MNIVKLQEPSVPNSLPAALFLGLLDANYQRQSLRQCNRAITLLVSHSFDTSQVCLL